MSLTFDHVGLTVADLPGMTRWYGAAFGLSVEFEFALEHVAFAYAPVPSSSDSSESFLVFRRLLL